MSYLRAKNGFTLVEMAVVLVIVALMLGGLLVPISAQIEQRNMAETRKSLEIARDALLGYAMAHGRLPCPATAGSNGEEAFDAVAPGNAANGICATFFNGLLPAATLGITPTDNSGFAIDGWGNNVVNRIRYAVANNTVNAVTNPFTRNNGIRNAKINFIAATNLLFVCTGKPSGATPYSSCTGTTALTRDAVFVVYSVGKNAATGGVGIDEIINPNPQDEATGNDPVFVSHEPQSAGAATGEFDDILTWVSSSSLIGKMVAAEQLP